MAHAKEEQTLIIIKPDAIHRGLLGQIMNRFERKGLVIVGMKMIQASDELLDEHYAHHADKAFFAELKNFMQDAPVVVVALSGINAITATRLIVGSTAGHEAEAGSIRGDFAMSVQSNLVHASDSPETAKEEIDRFFPEADLYDYERNDFSVVYSDANR
jgi:nucleoside-diphosphate kinase